MLDRQALKLRLKALDKTRVIQGSETMALETIFADILSAVAAEGRQLDEWEGTCLHSALAALSKHRPGMARTNLLHALEMTRHHEPCHRADANLESLSAALADLRKQSQRSPHAHHRPVVAHH
ncbi:MAG TPA: hypothetical protein VM661_05865 [Candidatus Sulfotelmatobacter sp.]|nr:hypothetical protein [Candidatus Sulfotelmatobacter sp.]